MRRFLLSVMALLWLAAPARAVDAGAWWGAHVTVASFPAEGGGAVRYARFAPPSARGGVVFFTGRTEPLEKYAETLADLADLPVALYVYEHRGQGDSSRSLPDREKGHVADWRLYVEDARRFLAMVRKESKGRALAVGASMGGGVLLAGMAGGEFPADGVALVSPMVRFVPDPFPSWLARFLTWGMDTAGWSESYAPSTGPWAPVPFEGNRLTSDRERLAAMNRLYADHPELRLGGPTVGWVRQMDLMGDAIEARGIGVATPTLMLLAEDDRVVVTGVARGICGRAPRCRAVTLPGRHELLREREPVRREAVGALRGFVGEVLFSPMRAPGL